MRRRGSYAPRACNHCRRRYVALTHKGSISSPTLNTQEIKVRWLQTSLRIMQRFWPRGTHTSSSQCRCVLTLCVVYLGSRECEEAHHETIRQLARELQSTTGPTKQIPRATARVAQTAFLHRGTAGCSRPVVEHPRSGITLFLLRAVVTVVYPVRTGVPEDRRTGRH